MALHECEGEGSPKGVLTPLNYNQHYSDILNSRAWISYGLTDQDWVEVGSGEFIGGEPSWEPNPLNGEGVRLIDNKEIAVGRPNYGKESVFGMGDSYTGVENIAVYSESYGTYTDRTSMISANDGTTLQFDNVLDGSCIYMASLLSNDDGPLCHVGIKADIDIEAVLGTGSIVFEFWNGTIWEEFNHQSTQSNPPYLSFGNERFEQTGSYQYMYNHSIIENLVASDPVGLGIDYKWIRLRIDGGITRSPSFDKIKLHPEGRSEIDPDGTHLFYGASKPIRDMNITYGTFEGALSGPADKDIFFSDNLDIGRKKNKFEDTKIHRSGFTKRLPVGICTACPVTLHFLLMPNEDKLDGFVNFTIRWATVKAGNLCYDSTDAPTEFFNEQSITSFVEVLQVDRYKLREVRIDLTIPTAIAEDIEGNADYLVVTFERDSLNVGDTYTGDIIMCDVGGEYSSYLLGGHI